MDRMRIARWILISALASVFLIFGIWKFAEPILWIGWMPSWMEHLLGFSRNTWLSVIGAIEILLALMLICGKRTFQRIAAVVIALHLVAIITQAGWTDTGVRDVGLLLSSIALWFLL